MAGPGLPESITAGVTTGHVTDHQKIHDLLNEFDTTDQASTKGDLLVFSGGTIKRLPIGTNDHVLTADSAQTAGLKWAAAAGGGGGGGDSYGIEPGLKPPASPHADDDEFGDANATDPTTTGWSWGNQASCAAEIRGGRLAIDGTSSSSRGIHGLFKTFPASGDVSAAVRCNGNHNLQYHAVGVAFLWGTLATPTAIEVTRYVRAEDRQVYWSRYSNYSTFSANRGNTARIGSAPQYLQIRYDATGGTVRGFWTPSLVGDGDWLPLAAAQSLTRPDFYGVVVMDESASPSGGLQVHADFFRVNWTPDYDPTA